MYFSYQTNGNQYTVFQGDIKIVFCPIFSYFKDVFLGDPLVPRSARRSRGRGRCALFARLRLSPYAASLGREPDLPPSGRACFASFRFALEENSKKRLLLLEFSFLLLFSLLVC